MTSHARPAWQLALELASILAATVLLGVLSVRVLVAVAAAGSWWMLPVAAVLGVLAADLVSGVVHWFGDSFFRSGTPVLGPLLIAPFREHHVDPDAIARHGPLELHGNSCLPVALAALPAALFLPDLAAPVWRFAAAWFVCLAVATAATNQCHVWAHRTDVPRVVGFLQQRGILLSPAAHARHHRGAHDRHYCITTGWWNPVLDRTRVLTGLAALLRRAA